MEGYESRPIGLHESCVARVGVGEHRLPSQLLRELFASLLFGAFDQSSQRFGTLVPDVIHLISPGVEGSEFGGYRLTRGRWVSQLEAIPPLNLVCERVLSDSHRHHMSSAAGT